MPQLLAVVLFGFVAALSTLLLAAEVTWRRSAIGGAVTSIVGGDVHLSG